MCFDRQRLISQLQFDILHIFNFPWKKGNWRKKTEKKSKVQWQIFSQPIIFHHSFDFFSFLLFSFACCSLKAKTCFSLLLCFLMQCSVQCRSSRVRVHVAVTVSKQGRQEKRAKKVIPLNSFIQPNQLIPASPVRSKQNKATDDLIIFL